MQYHDFANLLILEIFEVICSQTSICNLELSFSNIFSKNLKKVACFHDFYAKINICLYFTHKMSISQFSMPCLPSDVIVTSYITFLYQWKEDIHSYTMVLNLGLYDLPY